MSRIFVPSSGPGDWRCLLADPEKQWERRYSARTLAHCWEDGDGFPIEIRHVLSQHPALREDLNNLAPEDKKTLVESLVPGKIDVWWVTLEEGESGPEWGLGNFPFSFNPAIFYRLASEGKLKGLDKNGSDHPGAPRPHPLEQGQNFSRHQGRPP